MPFVPSLDPPGTLSRRTWMVVHPKGLVARREGERLVLPTDDDVEQMGLSLADAYTLGRLDEAEAVAAAFAGDLAALGGAFEPIGLRGLAMFLQPELFGVAGRAMHVVDWATTSQYCGRCGTKTVPSKKERCMTCPSCSLSIYPRIAPAIIVLVRKGELALLGRNARFPAPFYSTLAGFAEIGESLEETLAREVHEESGVRVGNIRYFGSQPWPFPHSLMIGFTAEWEGGDIRCDPEELADAQWFRADQLPMIPPPLSIARRLIDAWVTEVTSG